MTLAGGGVGVARRLPSRRRRRPNVSADERRRVIADLAASGLTLAKYATLNDLTVSTLSSWKRAIRNERLGAGPDTQAAQSDFVQIKLAPAVVRESGAAFEIGLACGRWIRVPASFAESDLVRLIRTVEEAC